MIAVEKLESRVLFSTTTLPRPDHVVVLIEEDHSYGQLFGPPVAPLQIWPVVLPNPQFFDPAFRTFEHGTASFTNAFSVGNHNLVDYQAIFSGVIPGPRDRPSPAHPYTAPNIASELNAAGLTFGGYAEGLPHIGYTGGGRGDYTDAHNPWILFNNVPASENLPFARFPHQYQKLPTVSYVVPNEQDNMHSGTVADADQWFHDNILPYARWANHHNSLLVVTWDESHAGNDQIPTLFYGPMIRPGKYTQHITQANILRTLEDMYGLAPSGRSANVMPITGIFKTGAARHSHPIFSKTRIR